MTSFKTKGICAREIKVELDGDKVAAVEFVGGCNGNTRGIMSLVKGMKVDDVIEKLEGINCGSRGTSCPAQLAEALKSMKAAQ